MTRSHSTEKWTKPWLGTGVLLFSLLGLVASVMLLSAELDLLNNPEADLLCDVSPLIGCSSSLLSPQAHLLGVPNAAVGLVAFGALAALGAVLMFGSSLPKPVWWGMAAGGLAGLAFVTYFVIQSVLVFKALCPYCMVTWVATLGVLPLLLGGSGASGSFGEGPRSAGRSILKYWWAIALVLYLLVILVVVVTMSDKLGYLF